MLLSCSGELSKKITFSPKTVNQTQICCVGLRMTGTGTRLLSTEVLESFKALKIEEVKPFVYNVQLNREKKLNALNKQLWG